MTPLCFLLFGVFSLYSSQVVPAGVYLTLRQDFINQVGNEIGLQIADEANAYTTAPPINGGKGSLTYTLSNFVFDVVLKDFAASLTDTTLSAAWNSFMWIVQFNYHICDDGGPINICESGWIQIFTLNNLATQLIVDIDVNLDGPLVKATVAGVTLGDYSKSCEVFVQCTDTFCLIPTSDIANAVANGFQQAFQSGLGTAVNNILNQRVNVLSTSFLIPSLNLEVMLNGQTASVNNNFVFSAKGVITPEGKTPPYTPTFTPPSSYFAQPPNMISIASTAFLPTTGLWALNDIGAFHYVITNSNLPPKITYKLNTNDFFLILLCPAFRNHPNMNVSITTSLANVTAASITPNGIVATLNLELLFSIYNATYSAPAWIYNVNNVPLLSYLPTASGQTISVNFSTSNWTSNVTVVKSWMGEVFTSGVGFLLDSVLSGIQLPLESFTVPAGLTISRLKSQFLNGFNSLSFDVSYKSPPFLQCPDHSECAIGNTCCQWGGSYGCCTLPNAECCEEGCCFQGCECDGTECAC